MVTKPAGWTGPTLTLSLLKVFEGALRLLERSFSSFLLEVCAAVRVTDKGVAGHEAGWQAR